MIDTKVVPVKAEIIPKNLDQATKAINDLAIRLVKALDEVDAARAEAANLNLELMERECRIDELERRIEWLLAHSNTEAEFDS